MTSRNKSEGHFPIQIQLHRSHIENMGVDVSSLSDQEMEYIAERLEAYYQKEMYSGRLKATVEYYIDNARSNHA